MTVADDALASLRGRFIVLGVTGGIAAYKAVELCRRLVDAGAHVAPVLTQAATRFVGKATFDALASEPAQTELFGAHDPIPHTRLGQSADLVIVAPATARVIGSYAAGLSADLLGATLLATTAPVVLAPAMHTEMWRHPAVQENLATLRRRGVTIVDPEAGRLAGGDVGEGRLAAPEAIVSAAAALLSGDLTGLKVVVSAGGTREAIDPVRYLSNRSSGKQGYALAEVARRRGAAVVLVTTVDRPAPAGVEVVAVESAEQLREAMVAAAADADIVVMAAAVADFRPKAPSGTKLKRRDGLPEIVLEPTADVLAELAERRPHGQVLVGFAAETDDPLNNGARKLADKGADLIVVNDVSRRDAGFAVDDNEVTILFDGGERRVPLAPKHAIAAAVLDAALERRHSAGRG